MTSEPNNAELIATTAGLILLLRQIIEQAGWACRRARAATRS